MSTPPAATSAGSDDASRSPPSPSSCRYSGFFPSRSRASTARPDACSTRQNANIPASRSSIPSPHSAQPFSSTSVSASEKNEWPARSSSARSSRWL